MSKASELTGRDLDAMVGVCVIGVLPESLSLTNRMPCYSTDIAAAMEVVEKMRERGWGCVLGFNGMTKAQNGAKFFKGFQGAGHSIFNAEDIEGYDAIAATIELAICRAALNAMEKKDAK